ncbi:MAG: protein kinase [Anaerolineales bacterium]|nr:protein kinase [Anaerolineales bacterium]
MSGGSFTLNVGDTLGAYRLVAFLGEGTLALVYKAYHAALDRHVALKVLKPNFQHDPSIRMRFQQEAQQSAHLHHPNILPIYDFVSSGERLYLAMRYIEGETLRNRLERGPLTVGDASRLAGGVGAALWHAHERGLLHGDVKPSNILLAADGNVYLTDFGIMRVVTGDLSRGTPDYVSPEQARAGDEVTVKADQYAFGVVLFEALTGTLPFRAADSRGVVLHHLMTLPPRPSSINGNIPLPVENVILKALAKAPDDRYADVSALVAAFQKAAAPPRPPTAPLKMPAGSEWQPEAVSEPSGEGSDVSIMLSAPGGQVLRLTGRSEYVLGRSEPTRPYQPDVDLAELNGMDMGVSRKHGRLHFERGRLHYTDLKSTNGSRINGALLYSEIPVMLEDGDELCLGKLVFRVYFGV